jgi:hypothetical protein
MSCEVYPTQGKLFHQIEFIAVAKVVNVFEAEVFGQFAQ